jgi:tetratricopeptide (TPR) repeat protein
MWYIRPMSRTLIPALTLAVVIGAASHAAAQSRRTARTDPDMAELAAYRLNAATLQKVTVAMQNFQKALETDPKYRSYMAAQKELEALRAKDEPTEADERRIEALEQQIEKTSREMDGGDAQTLGDMERAIARMPYMPDALAKSGLTPREYAKFSLAMLQAGMVAGMKKTGMMRDLPPDVPAENVQFMIDHEKEIAALTAMMQGR